MMMYLGEEEACDLGGGRDLGMQIGEEEDGEEERRREGEERSMRRPDKRDRRVKGRRRRERGEGGEENRCEIERNRRACVPRA